MASKRTDMASQIDLQRADPGEPPVRLSRLLRNLLPPHRARPVYLHRAWHLMARLLRFLGVCPKHQSGY